MLLVFEGGHALAAEEGEPVLRSSTVDRVIDAGATQNTVYAEELRETGADRLDEALEALVGITLYRASGLGVAAAIDGLPASQLVILVDGEPIARPLNSRAGPSSDLAALPLSVADVERVEVTRGAGPAGSADVGGVVVNIITRRRANEHRLNLDLRGGVASDPFQVVEVGVDAVGQVATGQSTVVDASASMSGEAAHDSDGDDAPDRPMQQLFGVGLGITWNGDGEDKLRARADVRDARTIRPALTDERRRELRQASPVLLNGLFDDRTTLTTVGLRIDGTWEARLPVTVEHRTSLRVQSNRFDKDLVRDGSSRRVHRTDDLGVRQAGILRWARGPHALVFEMDGRGGTTERRDPEESFRAEWAAAGLGVEERWSPTSRLQVSSRMYGEFHSDFGAGGVATMGLEIGLSEGLQARAQWDFTRRVPTPEERYFRFDHSEVGYIVLGNKALTPERLISGRAGLSGSHRSLSISAEAYAHQLDDAITTEAVATAPGGVATFRYVNVDRVRSVGASSALEWSDLPGGLSLQARYAWLPYSNVESTGARLDLSVVHEGSATIRGRWAADRVRGWVRTKVRSALSLPEGAPADKTLATVDLGASWRMGRGVSLQTDIENITHQIRPTWGPHVGLQWNLSLRYAWNSERF